MREHPGEIRGAQGSSGEISGGQGRSPRTSAHLAHHFATIVPTTIWPRQGGSARIRPYGIDHLHHRMGNVNRIGSDPGRSKEIQVDPRRSKEIQEDLGKYKEIRGDTWRYHEILGDPREIHGRSTGGHLTGSAAKCQGRHGKGIPKNARGARCATYGHLGERACAESMGTRVHAPFVPFHCPVSRQRFARTRNTHVPSPLAWALAWAWALSWALVPARAAAPARCQPRAVAGHRLWRGSARRGRMHTTSYLLKGTRPSLAHGRAHGARDRPSSGLLHRAKRIEGAAATTKGASGGRE